MVAGEDIAALAGLALAFAAVLLSVVTGNPLWDALGSIAVGVLLMIVALVITRELKAMVTGERTIRKSTPRSWRISRRIRKSCA